MPKVSVIVPVYAVEEYLPRCVDSILAQSFRDFELILVDDGSPDGSGKICDRYAEKDPRVTVVHQENGGVSSARNAGLDMASGKFAAFCDGDDYWEAGFLQNLVAAAEESGAEMVGCNYAAVDGQGNTLRESHRICGLRTLSSEAETLDYMINRVLCYQTGWEVWSRLFDMGVIRAHNIRFRGGYGEDLGFVLEMCLHSAKVCGIGYCGYRYFQRPGSVMRRNSHRAMLDELNECSRRFGKRYFEAIRNAELRSLYPVIHYWMLRGEYAKIPCTRLPEEIHRIRGQAWYAEQVRGIFGAKEYLRSHFAPAEVRNILIFSKFCLHKLPLLFRMENAVANRIIPLFLQTIAEKTECKERKL